MNGALNSFTCKKRSVELQDVSLVFLLLHARASVDNTEDFVKHEFEMIAELHPRAKRARGRNPIAKEMC